MLRWSEAWNMRTVQHFNQKWNVATVRFFTDKAAPEADHTTSRWARGHRRLMTGLNIRETATTDSRSPLTQAQLMIALFLSVDKDRFDLLLTTDSGELLASETALDPEQIFERLPALSKARPVGAFTPVSPKVELTPEQRADLISFVKDDGKGFVAAHTATTAFLSWPEFGELIGGQYDGHPWGSAPGTLINEDPSFPATKHFPATFPLTDEFYQTKDYSREKMRVVLRLDVSKMPANTGVHRTDGDFPVAVPYFMRSPWTTKPDAVYDASKNAANAPGKSPVRLPAVPWIWTPTMLPVESNLCAACAPVRRL
jgi:hypothetical protein